MKKYLAVLITAIIPSIAFAQNAVRQNGSVTKFDIPAWIQDRTLESGSKTFQDNARGFNPFNVYDGGTSDGITLEEAITTGANHKFSFGHNAAGDAIITIAPMNGAPNKSLFLNKNGTVYEFPFSTTGVVGPSTTTVGHGACWNNTSGTLLSDCTLSTGDIVGPGSAIDGDVAVFNGTTGKLLKDSGFAPSTITATTKAVAASYSVVNADNHTTLNLASGNIANQTVTVGALSGFTDPKFTVAFCNRDTRPWKIVSTDAGTLKLYPNQCNMLLPNSAGGLRYWQPLRRHLVVGGRTLYMGPGGACNDNNDGFTADAAGQICTFTALFNIAQGEMTCDAGGINIVAAVGSYNQVIAVAGPPPPGCGDGLTFFGAGSSGGSTITCPVGSHCFDVEDHAILTVGGFRVVCTSSTGFYSRQFAVLDASDIIVGDCAGGTILAASDGHINLVDPAHPVSIQGNAAAAVNVSGSAGLISAGSGTLTVTSSPVTITNFVIASAQGQAAFGPLQIPGGGAVTGTRWAADTLGLILTTSASACDAFFNNVGTIVGAATNGGICK